MILAKINIHVNKGQFKSIKGKKTQDFFIDILFVYTRGISQERKQTPCGDSKWELFISFSPFGSNRDT